MKTCKNQFVYLYTLSCKKEINNIGPLIYTNIKNSLLTIHLQVFVHLFTKNKQLSFQSYTKENL